MATFNLRVIAHDKVFFDGEAQALFIPAPDGMYEVLAHHAECVVAIEPGELKITDDKGQASVAVCGRGYLDFHVKSNTADVLVDTVERPEEIDIRRAQEAKERAEEELRQKQSIREYYQSQAALARAMARLKTANKYAKR